MAMKKVNIASSFSNSTNDNADIEKDAKIWVNVGLFLKFGYEGEEPEGTFVSIPVGIPLDKIKDATVPSKGNLRKIKLCSNQLKAKLLSLAESIKPGDSLLLNDLKVELRVAGSSEPTANDDDIDDALAQLDAMFK